MEINQKSRVAQLSPPLIYWHQSLKKIIFNILKNTAITLSWKQVKNFKLW